MTYGTQGAPKLALDSEPDSFSYGDSVVRSCTAELHTSIS